MVATDHLNKDIRQETVGMQSTIAPGAKSSEDRKGHTFTSLPESKNAFTKGIMPGDPPAFSTADPLSRVQTIRRTFMSCSFRLENTDPFVKLKTQTQDTERLTGKSRPTNDIPYGREKNDIRKGSTGTQPKDPDKGKRVMIQRHCYVGAKNIGYTQEGNEKIDNILYTGGKVMICHSLKDTVSKASDRRLQTEVEDTSTITVYNRKDISRHCFKRLPDDFQPKLLVFKKGIKEDSEKRVNERNRSESISENTEVKKFTADNLGSRGHKRLYQIKYRFRLGKITGKEENEARRSFDRINQATGNCLKDDFVVNSFTPKTSKSRNQGRDWWHVREVTSSKPAPEDQITKAELQDFSDTHLSEAKPKDSPMKELWSLEINNNTSTTLRDHLKYKETGNGEVNSTHSEDADKVRLSVLSGTNTSRQDFRYPPLAKQIGRVSSSYSSPFLLPVLRRSAVFVFIKQANQLDRQSRDTSCGDDKAREERKTVMMQHLQTFFSLSRKRNHRENKTRKMLLLKEMKRFFRYFDELILASCAVEGEHVWLQHDAKNPVPKQQITVYMMHSNYPSSGGLRDVQKPLSTNDHSPLFNREMCREIDRYGTFEAWPRNAAAWPNRLAAAGFYYSSQGDEVICYSCGLTYSGWRAGMVPMDVHRSLSSTCGFVTHQAGNVPVVEDEQAKTRLKQINGYTPAPTMPSSGYYSMSSQPHQEATETQQRSTSSLAPSATPADGLVFPSLPTPQRPAAASPSGQPFMSAHITTPGTSPPRPHSAVQSTQATTSVPAQSSPPTPRTGAIQSDFSGTLGISTDRPQYPNFAVTTIRMNTYNNGWPHSHTQTPKDLAEAGFFYSGHGDSVRCFFCGTGLRNWDTGDNPWVEHARWSPHCVYLNQHQGPTFVNLVQELSSGGNQVNYQQVLSILKDTPEARSAPEQAASSPAAVINRQDISRSNSVEDSKHSTILDHQDDSMAEENERLKQQTVCKICLDKEVTIVFLPCGHLCCCAECAPALRKCPMCRADVKGTVRAYMG